MIKSSIQALFSTFMIILGISIFTLSCEEPAAQDEKNEKAEETIDVNTEEKEFSTLVFRSDGFYPGIVSEWLEVVIDHEGNLIEKLYYWNTSDEEKQELNIIGQEFFDDEISGYSGSLDLLGQIVEFGMYEDRLNLVHDEYNFQEFFLE